MITEALAALRVDSWRSLIGSFGGRRDRGRVDQVRFDANAALDDVTLSGAYRDLWLVRRVVEARPDDALRSGWGIDDEKIPEFIRLNTATHPEGAFQRSLRMAALKGGAGLFIGYAGGLGQDLLAPAPEGAPVAFLEVFDKFQLQGQERVREVDSPEYDRPQVWQVTGSRRAGLRFHTSRLIKFPGAPRATELGASEQDRDWGDSALQSVWEDVVRYGVFWQAVSHLMQLASVGVLSLAGLIEMLATKRREDAEARIDLLNDTLSLSRLLLLDAKQGESYHREAVSFTDMPALLQELQQATSGAAHIPATRLFGRAPAGLNATGESDTRGWYDDVAAYRQSYIVPRLSEVLARTDRKGADVELDFPPLWQPTDKERAEVRAAEIGATERLWTMNVVSEDEIRAALIDGKWVEETVSGPAPEKPEPPELPTMPFGGPPRPGPPGTTGTAEPPPEG